jgi:hypothetical protein
MTKPLAKEPVVLSAEEGAHWRTSYSLPIGVYFTFFLTKISEIYTGSPYPGGACPPKQGHEPVPIN